MGLYLFDEMFSNYDKMLYFDCDMIFLDDVSQLYDTDFCGKEAVAVRAEDFRVGSLTLCLPLDFHNPLHYSPLRLIFLSNFCFFSVLFCTLVV